ncbi:GrpB family protein [Sporolactobacillus sp. THM19-2]|uniref:GrpB family protein n=1 Tax=Sporolactobacillus sp. THM19-2 TaxID=2511171 RepID=UPI00101EEA37|nr:GrpB family protein [Sporolactobacillus sp. THM19-2]RYL92208.1 GrpB family protein [Sporolactobacillus sp. THM19-2]
MVRHVVVTPYQETWEQAYRHESSRLLHHVNTLLQSVYHVGSTSIPGMAAKPTIDILAETLSIQEVDSWNQTFEKLGYQPLGENGIKGRRYFCKEDAEGNHLVHLHIFEKDSEEVIRHLAFRDYLRTHSEDADFYSGLKLQLAEAFPYDAESYQYGKSAAVKKIEERALDWWYA